MKKDFEENIFTSIVFVTMVMLPLLNIIALFLPSNFPRFLGNPLQQKFFLQEEFLSLIGIVASIIILFFIVIRIFKNKSSINYTLSDCFVVISIIFCIISIIFSKNINKSLHGEYAYSETPLQVLAYFSLFFICTNITKKDNKIFIIKTFIVLAIIEIIIAFMQNFGLYPISSLFDAESHTKSHMAFGLTEHCNYFASIAIIFTAILSGIFIYSNKKSISFITLILSTFSCFATFFTYTRIGWVGIFSILFALLFLEICIYKKYKDTNLSKHHFKKLLILFIIFLTCFLTVGITSGQLIKDVKASKEELSDFDEFGTKRGTIWKVGLSSLKKYPLTGVGFDNYRYSFNIYPKNFGWSQNKGHNEFIHIFVTQGIPSGINYLLFAFYCCLFPFIKILKGESEFGKSDITKILLITIVAFFIQSLFNSSVTNVAPYKWIIMGLLLPKIEQKNFIKKERN